MMNYLPIIINGLLTSWTCFYALSKLLKEKINYRSYQWWLVFVVNALWLIVSYLVTKNIIRIIIYYIIFAITARILFNRNFINHFFYAFIVIFLFTIAETLLTMSIISIHDMSLEEFKEQNFNTMINNALIALIVCSMVNIRRLIKFFEHDFLANLKSKRYTIMTLILSVLTITMLLYYVFFEISTLLAFIFILVLLGMYLLLIVGLYNEKNQNLKLQIKYEVLINNLNEYEKMLDAQRINNHENKNHLLTISGMLDKEDSKVKEYIANLLNNKLNDDEGLLYKTKKLPIGGLQGLIYQKLLVMKEKNININLEVSNHLNKIFFEKISNETNYHICTIVGVILDNAIEAVETLKDKNIGINVYSENDYLVISISNNFEGEIDLTKIDERGYSTKGKGRGYGLYLVKQILDRNSTLGLEREIIGKIFKQKLKIKI